MLVPVIKYPYKTTSERTYTDTQFKGTEHQSREVKVAGVQTDGHTTLRARKQASMNVALALSFFSPFFYSARSPSMTPPTADIGHPGTINLIRMTSKANSQRLI